MNANTMSLKDARHFTAVQTRFSHGEEIIYSNITSTLATDLYDAGESILEQLNRNPSRRGYLTGPRGWEAQGYPMIVDGDRTRIVRPWELLTVHQWEHPETHKFITAEVFGFQGDGHYGLRVEAIGLFVTHTTREEIDQRLTGLRIAMEELGFEFNFERSAKE